MQRLAQAFLVLGTLMLLFVAYQLWGTAVYEHQSQDRLRSELASHLHAPPSSPEVAKSTSPSSGDSATVGAPPPSAATAAAGARAPAEGSAEGFISIPRLGINDTAFVEGVAESDLQEGPGHYPSTVLPGQAGNVGIAGHRTTYGAPFYNLDQLQPGDPIVLQVPEGTFTYTVVRSTVVQPNDTSVLAPTSLPLLTLTTCNPRYSASSRLVVTALLQQSKGVQSPQADPPPAATTASSERPASGGPPPASKGSSLLAGSDASSRGTVGDAVFWGELTLLVFFGVRILWRLLRARTRTPSRARGSWALLAVGSPAVMVLLFVFYEHVSLALPSSF